MSAPYWGGQFAGAISASGISNLIIDGGTNGAIYNTSNGTTLNYQQYSQGIWLRNCTNVVVRNLSITNIYQNGGSDPKCLDGGGQWTSDVMLFQNSSRIKIYNCVLKSSRMGVAVNFDGGWTTEAVEVYSNYISDHCWQVWFGAGTGGENATNISVHDNEITDWSNWQYPCYPGPDIYHTDGIFLYTSPGRLLTADIYNNYIHGDLGNGSPTAFLYGSTGSRVRAFNNLFVQTGTHCSWLLGIGGAGSNVIYNNTLVALNSGCGIDIMLGPSNNIVENNVFSSGRVMYGSYSPITNCLARSDYNVIYNVGSPAYGSDGATWYSPLQWNSAGFDVHSSANSPLLDQLYRPLAGSSAVGVATNLTAVSLTPLNQDKSGALRSQVGPWDAGAYSLPQRPPPPSGLKVVTGT